MTHDIYGVQQHTLVRLYKERVLNLTDAMRDTIYSINHFDEWQAQDTRRSRYTVERLQNDLEYMRDMRAGYIKKLRDARNGIARD